VLFNRNAPAAANVTARFADLPGGLSAPGAFSPWEQSQLRLLKAEFDAEAAGVTVEVVRG
jgi:hypothetical protein